MWNTAETNVVHLSHDMPCSRCGHARHTFLACSDLCDCVPPPTPGVHQAYAPVRSAVPLPAA